MYGAADCREVISKSKHRNDDRQQGLDDEESALTKHTCESNLPEDVDMSSADMCQDLPEKARNLLDAAHRLLLREGYERLTWNRIAKEANENKSTIGYYFGDKNTLVLALLRRMGQTAQEQLMLQSESLPPEADRIDAYLDGLEAFHKRPDSLAFFDVLPNALREDCMRKELADLYVWYHAMTLRILGIQPLATNVGDDQYHDQPFSTHDQRSLPTPTVDAANLDPRLQAAAWLWIASVDGILVQKALNPPEYDPRMVYRSLAKAIRHLVEEVSQDIDRNQS